MASDDIRLGTLGGLLALGLLAAFWPSGAAANTCDAPFMTDLVTGTGKHVGYVKVCNDQEKLTVTYETITPWCVKKTNLQVASDLEGIPKTILGTPNWLKFDHRDEIDCEGTVPYDIPLADIGDGGVAFGATLVVAARAVVEGEDWHACLLGDICVAWGAGTRFRPRLPATYFSYTVQEPPAATSCVCDSVRAPRDTLGKEVLAQLCPNGGLASGNTFQDSMDVVGPSNSSLAYLMLLPDASSESEPTCKLQDTNDLTLSFNVTESEAEACIAHLRASCGQPEPHL
jgi:hypothetical protein